jgi:hypothetical protein
VKNDYYLLHASCLPGYLPVSIHPARYISAPTGMIFMKFDISAFFRKYVEKTQFSFKSNKRIAGTLHEDQYTYMIVNRLVLLRMRNFSDINCTENQNTHFIFNKGVFPENLAVREIMWTNTLELDRP